MDALIAGIWVNLQIVYILKLQCKHNGSCKHNN
jgi:hypothetical protein